MPRPRPTRDKEIITGFNGFFWGTASGVAVGSIAPNTTDVAVADGVAVWITVGVGVLVGIFVGVGVGVFAGVGVGVDVLPGVGVGVDVGAGVGVAVGPEIAIVISLDHVGDPQLAVYLPILNK